jgi:hypothetical protein
MFSITTNILLFFVIVVLGVHCDIYQSSYTVSYLNSTLPSFSFILPPPFLEQFQQVTFSIYIHEYIIFIIYSHSYTLFLYLSPPQTLMSSSAQDLFYLPVLCFWKGIILFKIAIHCFIMTFSSLYYKLNCFTTCIFLLSTLVLFLW